MTLLLPFLDKSDDAHTLVKWLFSKPLLHQWATLAFPLCNLRTLLCFKCSITLPLVSGSFYSTSRRLIVVHVLILEWCIVGVWSTNLPHALQCLVPLATAYARLCSSSVTHYSCLQENSGSALKLVHVHSQQEPCGRCTCLECWCKWQFSITYGSCGNYVTMRCSAQSPHKVCLKLGQSSHKVGSKFIPSWPKFVWSRPKFIQSWLAYTYAFRMQ